MIQIKKTQYPDIIKFEFSSNIFPESKEYNKESDTKDFQLAGKLLQFPFINSLLTMGNFIAVEKKADIDWEMVQDELKDLIEQEMLHFKPSNSSALAVEVYIESTPNPEVIKLVSNILLYDGIAEATNTSETEHFPLAEFLLKLPYVKEVFVSQNYISLTKNPEENWQDHSLEIRDIVAQYLRSGKKPVNKDYIAQKAVSVNRPQLKEFSDIEKQIQQILEEHIKPAVAGDGGNIDLVSFDNETKTAKMLLQGACSGCPSSTFTLKNGIESMLKEMLPGQVENVEAINA